MTPFAGEKLLIFFSFFLCPKGTRYANAYFARQSLQRVEKQRAGASLRFVKLDITYAVVTKKRI